ncbi:MAG: hypothetical protein ABW185_19550 [Sedimenticola sp.]
MATRRPLVLPKVLHIVSNPVWSRITRFDSSVSNTEVLHKSLMFHDDQATLGSAEGTAHSVQSGLVQDYPV